MSHHPVQFSNWTGTYQLGNAGFPKLSKFFLQLVYFVHLKTNLEANLYYLQIKFKHKIPLSSTHIIQFYTGDLPLGTKGKRVHSSKTMVDETLYPRMLIIINY